MLRRLLPAAALLAAGCSFDLDLPERPVVSSVNGTVVLEDGGGAAGISVVLSNDEDEDGGVARTTTATGTFEYLSLTPGDYTLSVAPAGYIDVLRGFSLAPGTNRTLKPITLYPLQRGAEGDGRINGKVIVMGGGDVNGAEVSFFVQSTAQQAAVFVVGPSGVFSQPLAPNTYTVKVSHPYYVSPPPLPDVAVTEKLITDLTAQPLTLTLNPARVRGHVSRERDLSTPTDAVGATVTSNTGVSATTDSAGNFDLGGLPAGTFELIITLSGYHDPVMNRTVKYLPAQTTMVGDIELALDRGTVIGQVLMKDNTPLADVTASLDIASGDGGVVDGGLALNPYSASVAPSAADPSRGDFVIRSVPIGVWSVKASRENYITVTSSALPVVYKGTADTGLLQLSRAQGDFIIDDGDMTNTPGFTRTPGVTLRLQGATNAAEVRVSESAAALGTTPLVPFGALPDGGTLTPTAIPWGLSAGDGTKTLYLQYRDAMNNLSPVLSSNIVLDTVAPSSPSLRLEDDADFTRSNVALLASVSAIDPRGTGVDNVSGVGFVKLSASSTLDGTGQLTAPRQAYAPNLTFTRATTMDGAQVVYAQFIDNAGNASALATDTVVVDTLPPSGSMTITRGAKATLNGYTGSPLVDLQLMTAAEPNGGYVNVKLANENAADLSGAVLQRVRSSIAWFIDPTEGARTVHYTLVDAAGNAAGQSSQQITYDITPPQGTLTLTSGTPTSSLDAGFSASATDPNGNPLSPTQGLTVSEDPAFASVTTLGPVALPPTFSFGLTAGDGMKVVYARFRDAAGNDSLATAAVTVDQTPPQGSISLEGTLADGTASTTVTSTATVTLHVQQSGASLIALGNESLATCPASAASYVALTSATLTNQTLTGSASPREMRACLRDAAGNTTGPLVATITLDTSQPTGCQVVLQGRKVDGSNAPAGRTALRDLGVTLTSCVETPAEIVLTESAVTCSASAALAWVPYSAALAYSLTGADGAATVRGCVRDAARNTAALGSAAMTLDTTAPTAASITVNSGAAYVNASQVSGGMVTLSVQGSATGAQDWAIGESLTPTGFLDLATNNPRNQTITVSSDGVRTLYALFRDDLQNVLAVPVSDSIIVDTAPPTGAGGTGSPSIVVQGTLADGTVSTTNTSTANVTVLATVEGASEVLIGNENVTTCATTGYTALTSTSLPFALTGATSPRTVKACFRDAAGNTAGPFTKTIALDVAAPGGCFLTVDGFKADSSTGPANRTALTAVRVQVLGCSEVPTEVFLTESAVSCVATASFPWVSFSSPQNFTLAGGDGTHTVRGCVRDAAGNVGNTTADDTVLDTTPPTNTFIVVNGGATYINASQVSAGSTTLSITGSATGATEWAIDESASPSGFVTFTSPRMQAMAVAADGVRTLNAMFRDDLLNTTSAPVSDSIIVDTTAPLLSAMAIDVLSSSAPVAGFTPSEAVTVAVAGSNDAVDAFLAEHLGAGTCVASDFASSPRQAVVSGYAFVLQPGEGVKRVCLRYRDAAGNTSGMLEDIIVLDKTAPTTPVIQNADQYTNHPNLAPFTVNIVPSVDPYFYTYEKLGGLDPGGVPITSWTATTTLPGQPTRIVFYEANDGGETGVRNEFRLRARDDAGNVSGESMVAIHADTNPPDPITWKPEWVDNSDAKATIYFLPTPPAVSDLSFYKVYYGAAPGFLDSESAGFANEGVSPIRINPRSNTTLSGLPNGAATYVRIRPVDLAGNVGEWLADGGTLPLRLQPGEVSMNELSVLTVPAPNDKVQRLARQGNVLYVASTTSNCGASSPSGVTLSAVDMRELMSPVQKGQAQTAINGPFVASSQTFADGVQCLSNASNADLISDGHWLYLLTPTRLRIFEMNQPLVIPPSTVATLDLTGIEVGANFRAESMSLIGDRLAITGRRGSVATPGNFATVLSLAPLFDVNGVAPVLGDRIGGHLLWAISTAATSSAVSRDRIVISAFDAVQGPTNQQVNLSATLSMAATPTMQGTGFGGPLASTRVPVSGDLVYYAAPTFGLTNFTLGGGAGIWAGGNTLAPAVNSAYLGGGQFEVLGHEVFLPDDGAGLRAIDMSQPTFTRDVGVYAHQNPQHVIAFGNYAALAVGTSLHFFELATPRALRTFTSDPGAGYHPRVVGSFLYTGMGYTFDLQNGLAPAKVNVSLPSSSCTLAAAYADDLEVNQRGDGFRVQNIEVATDHDNATSNMASYDVTLPAGRRVTDLELWGTHLVVAEVRAAGVFVEVFRAGKLKNRSGNQLLPGDSLGAVQVSALTGSGVVANLALQGGRAAIGIEPQNDGTPPPTGAGAYLYFVDLNGLMDDSVATGAGAVHGPVTLDAVTDVAMQGNFAYVTTLNGLRIYDITEVMDANAATMLPGALTPVASVLAGNAFDGIFAMGSTVLITPTDRVGVQTYAEGIYSIDVSNPASPDIQGYFPVGGETTGCSPLGDASRRMRAKITVAGSRAYYTSGGTLRTLELE